MHSYIGIVDKEKWSDGISRIQDFPNNLTCQSAGMNYTLRYPLHSPVTDGEIIVTKNA